MVVRPHKVVHSSAWISTMAFRSPTTAIGIASEHETVRRVELFYEDWHRAVPDSGTMATPLAGAGGRSRTERPGPILPVHETNRELVTLAA